MKIKYIILLVFGCLTLQVYSQNVTQQEAEIIASNFIKNIHPTKKYSVSTIKAAIPQYYQNKLSYYVVPFKEGGYTIVSAYDGYEPILAITDQGEFDQTNLPPSFEWWMSLYSQRIQELAQSGLKDNSSSEKWEEYKNNNVNSLPINSSTSASLAPLLTSKWGQGKYYNSLIEDGGKGTNCYDGKCAAGCVAIAGSQIFRYWEYPSNTYNWANMPDKLSSTSTTAQINAVAFLIADVGKEVGMSYCSSGCSSGAVTSNLRYVFERKGYSYESYTTFSTNAQILQKIKTELDNRRPLITRGSNANNEGHAFIFDGYNGDMIHINWGWEGSQDGYFYIDSHNFTKGQAAIIGLTPPCNSSLNAGEAIAQNPNMLETYLYSPPIHGYFQTATTSYPESYRTIRNGRNANYKAYQEITLNPGFSVELGGTLEINIVNCPY